MSRFLLHVSPFYVYFSLAQLAYHFYCLLINNLLVHICFLLQLTQLLYCCSNLLLTTMHTVIYLFILQWPLYIFVQPKIYIHTLYTSISWIHWHITYIITVTSRINYSLSISIFVQQWFSYTYLYDHICSFIILISYAFLTTALNTSEQSLYFGF